MYVVRLERFKTYHYNVVNKVALIISQNEDEHLDILRRLTTLTKRPRKRRIIAAGDVTPFMRSLDGFAIYVRYRYDVENEAEDVDWELELHSMIYGVTMREISESRSIVGDD